MCFVSRPSAVCYSSLLCFYAPIGSSRSSLFSCLFFCDVSGSTLLHPSVSVKQQNFKIWTFSWQSCPPDVARALEVVVAWVARRCTSLALWKFDCILTGFFCCCCVIRTGCHFPWTLGLVVNWTSAILHFCRSPATSLDHPPTLPAPFGQSAIPRLKKTTETIRKQKKMNWKGKKCPWTTQNERILIINDGGSLFAFSLFFLILLFSVPLLPLRSCPRENCKQLKREWKLLVDAQLAVGSPPSWADDGQLWTRICWFAAAAHETRTYHEESAYWPPRFTRQNPIHS